MSLQLIFLTNVSLLSVDLACRILCILDVLCGWREESDGERSLDTGAGGKNGLELDPKPLNLMQEQRLG